MQPPWSNLRAATNYYFHNFITKRLSDKNFMTCGYFSNEVQTLIVMLREFAILEQHFS